MPHHPSHAREQGPRASLGKLRGRGQWDGRQMQSPGSLGPASPVKALPSMLPRLQGGQLSSLSRGNLAHSARVTRSTKAAPCRLAISIVFVLAVSVSSSKSSSTSSLPPYLSFVFGPVYRPLRSQRWTSASSCPSSILSHHQVPLRPSALECPVSQSSPQLPPWDP